MFLLIADTLIQDSDIVKATIAGSTLIITLRVVGLGSTTIDCGTEDEASNMLFRLYEKLNGLKDLPLIPNFS